MAEKEEEEPTVQETENELISKVRKQIEYYFSKENLQQDAFLASQMDASMSVAIAVVMKFPKILSLTQDEAIVVKALEDSSLNIVDGRIKSVVKTGGRSTIILREIPTDANEDEVREIFNYENCKTISSMRSDIGDTWFVVMESEEDAKDTLLDLRLKKRTFCGQPVKARMKNEPMARSFYPIQQPPAAMVFPGMPMPPFGGVMPPYGYPMMANGVGASLLPRTDGMKPYGSESQDSSDGIAFEGDSASQNDGRQRDRRQALGGTGYGSGISGGRLPSGRDNGRERKMNGGGVVPRPSGAIVNGVDKKNAKGKKDLAPKPASIEITAANFPPLHQIDETPIPTPGYKSSFLKYSYDEILGIVKDTREVALPATIKPDEHSAAMDAVANQDLLRRQRTLTIDETREHLRQGRPIHREAISSGPVDYGSLIWGDGYQKSSGSIDLTPPTAPSSSEAGSPPPTLISGDSSSADFKDKEVLPSPADVVDASSIEHAESTIPKKVAGSWAAMVMATSAVVPETGVGPTPRQSSGLKSNSKETGSKPKTVAVKGADGSKEKENKKGAGAAAERKKGEKEKGTAERPPKKEGRPKKTEEKSDAEENEVTSTPHVEKALVLSSWGGKPTFANILKQQAEAGETNAPTSPKRNSPSVTSGIEVAAVDKPPSPKPVGTPTRKDKAPAPIAPTSPKNSSVAVDAQAK